MGAMLDKKYQVFISSTYKDLINERNAVSKIILDLDHIPAGMELFPAADSEQFDYIKKVIDQCDYYVLILAGKYGSVSEATGRSYTEMEYDYAIAQGKVVLAFVYQDLGKLQADMIEADDPAKKSKLEALREKVTHGRLVRLWSDQDQLAGHVAVSLSRAFSQYPQIGWVRGDTIADTDAVRQLNAKNAEIEALRQELDSRGAGSIGLDEIADLDDIFEYVLTQVDLGGNMSKITMQVTWGDIALEIQKKIFDTYGTFALLEEVLLSFTSNTKKIVGSAVSKDDVLTVYLQMQLYGQIRRTGEKVFRPTEKGSEFLTSQMAARKKRD